MKVVRVLLALSFSALVVHVFRYHTWSLTNTQDPLSEMSLLLSVDGGIYFESVVLFSEPGNTSEIVFSL